MKLITFVIPCYNSQDYMRTCIDSILETGDNDIEILIINDGSKDSTGEIADQYQGRFPGIVKAVHKENGGHGSGINAGLAIAQGRYFKVVDSDDWLDTSSLVQLLKTIRLHQDAGQQVDLYITNFVYEHIPEHTRYVSSFGKYFPSSQIVGWKNTKQMYLWHMLLMHALIYRTELLRSCDISLPEHTCYVDNLFAYIPLSSVRKLYYMNIDLYRYYIGRSDQSVTMENMTARYDQQIRVMRCMLKAHPSEDLEKLKNPLRGQMYHYLHCVMGNTWFFTTQGDTPERRGLFQALWDELKQDDPELYRKMRHMLMVMILNLFPWNLQGKITRISYRFLVKHVKLGI